MAGTLTGSTQYQFKQGKLSIFAMRYKAMQDRGDCYVVMSRALPNGTAYALDNSTATQRHAETLAGQYKRATPQREYVVLPATAIEQLAREHRLAL